MKHTGSRAMYRAWNRDKNERYITDVLDRYHIPYILMPPKAGFDILVFTAPLQCWEIKNPDVKWNLTQSEHERQKYCKSQGIPYRVIENMEQAVEALAERNKTK